jgi:hypothetical protein
MTRYLLAGAAAFALMTGAASAQTVYQESTTTVQPTLPPALGPATPEAVYKEKKSRTIHPDGTESVKRQTESMSSSGGVRATETSRTTTPDGAETRSQTEAVTSPLGDKTTNTTTTTIERH